jgi:cytochrome b pre-mRNA-processing protein 3
MLSKLFKRGEGPETPAALMYRAVVDQARSARFYADFGVPDTVDGRFELIALHMFLVLHRLKTAPAADLSQAVFDTMFADMDRSLREMGAGDLGVGRRVRAMAEGLYGRIAAYEAGLAGEDPLLMEALRRNLYGTASDGPPSEAALQAVSTYMRTAMLGLAGQSDAQLGSGQVAFPPAPTL